MLTVTRSLVMVAVLASAQDLFAQTPGQLPSRTFTVDFQSVTGHTSTIQQITLAGTTIVVEYDAATYLLSWPDHRNHERPYWIRNTGSERVNGLIVRVANDNGQLTHDGGGFFSGIDPGERLEVSYLFAWNRFFPDNPCDECFDQIAGQEVPRTWTLTVTKCALQFAQADGTCSTPSAPTITVNQLFTVRAQSTTQRPLNATVNGRVYDAVTGLGLTTGVVEVLNPSGEMRKAPFNLSTKVPSDNAATRGNYSISVPSMTALVRCVVPGYQTRYEVAVVASGQTVTVDCAMSRMPWTASFTLTTQISTSPGIWGWAVTPDGYSVVVTSALSGEPATILSSSRARMINLVDGTVTWDYLLGASAMGPSISPNGAHVAIPAQGQPGTVGTSAVKVLDRTTGALLYSRTPPSSANVELAASAYSPDGQFLVVGGLGGELWLLNTSTYATVWFKQEFAPRQTRAVLWSPDSQTIYASSDPSLIQALNPSDGSERWRSHTTSFAYQDNIAQNASGTRIAVKAKFGGLAVLDQNGQDVFREESREGGGHAVVVAPDASSYLSSTGAQNGAHLQDPTGKLYWWSPRTSEGVMFTADEKFVLMGAALYDLSGTELWTNTTAENGVSHVAVITPDKRHILVAGESGVIYVFEGQVCMPTVSSTSASFGVEGGSGSITISAETGCAWSATSSDAFLTLTGASSGSGNGTVPYSVASGGPRIGRLTVAGWSVAVSQALFTDDPLVTGTTPIQAAHLSQLRQHVATLRARYPGLAAVQWTDGTIVAGVTTIKAVHVLELRTALTEVYAAAGLPAPVWAATITPSSTLISAAHIAEIRSVIAAIY